MTSKYTITRRFVFDAAHRVLGHENKCRHLHGHRYVAYVTMAPAPATPELDKLGRVVDFSVIKAILGKWIDDNWDHNIILHPDDPLLMIWNEKYTVEEKLDPPQESNHLNPKTGKRMHLTRCSSTSCLEGAADLVFGGKQPYVMPTGKNPTAEYLAEVLFTAAFGLFLDHNIDVKRVKIYETENCYAEFSG